MKNLILFSILLISIPFVAQAQNKATYDVIVDSNNVLREYRAKVRDTVSTNKQTFTYTIFNKGQADYKQKFTNWWQIAIDSISGTPATINVEYQKRMNIFTTWATDSLQYFNGTQSDTTMIFTDTVAAPEPYRRIKVTYGSGFQIKIDWLSGIFLKD